jgi:hypothetical protein
MGASPPLPANQGAGRETADKTQGDQVMNERVEQPGDRPQRYTDEFHKAVEASCRTVYERVWADSKKRELSPKKLKRREGETFRDWLARMSRIGMLGGRDDPEADQAIARAVIEVAQEVLRA